VNTLYLHVTKPQVHYYYHPITMLYWNKNTTCLFPLPLCYLCCTLVTVLTTMLF